MSCYPAVLLLQHLGTEKPEMMGNAAPGQIVGLRHNHPPGSLSERAPCTHPCIHMCVSSSYLG